MSNYNIKNNKYIKPQYMINEDELKTTLNVENLNYKLFPNDLK